MRYAKRTMIGVGLATATFALVAISWLVDRHPVGNPRVPSPAKPVSLERYAGRWYEIARYDQRFERGCEAATAQYDLRPDGRIDVLNRCREQNGKMKEARGIGRVVDQVTNTKLKVSFFGPFYGDYWILDHADDYSWSIVGEPSGRYLWILSRNPNPDGEQVRSLVNRVSDLGYNASMLVFDRH